MVAKKLRAKTQLKKNEDTKISIAMDAAKLHGLGESNNDKEHPSLSLKYYDCEFECFSELTKEDLKSFSDVCRKFRQLTWLQIMGQGGKRGNKTGLAPTVINRKQLPKSILLDAISDDIEFMELRLSQKARIFGFRSQATFFLVFLDHNHKICK